MVLFCCLQISKTYTHYAATILFFFFGFKTLYDTFFGEEVSSRGSWQCSSLHLCAHTSIVSCSQQPGHSALRRTGLCYSTQTRPPTDKESCITPVCCLLPLGMFWLLLQGENELEQVEQELSNSNSNGSKRSLVGEDEKKQSKALTRLLYMLFSPVFLKAFTLTFLAEWGDRSQIATIG